MRREGAVDISLIIVLVVSLIGLIAGVNLVSETQELRKSARGWPIGLLDRR